MLFIFDWFIVAIGGVGLDVTGIVAHNLIQIDFANNEKQKTEWFKEMVVDKLNHQTVLRNQKYHDNVAVQ